MFDPFTKSKITKDYPLIFSSASHALPWEQESYPVKATLLHQSVSVPLDVVFKNTSFGLLTFI